MYWRTCARQEKDRVIEHRNDMLGIEVKSATRPTHADTAELRAFAGGSSVARQAVALPRDGLIVAVVQRAIASVKTLGGADYDAGGYRNTFALSSAVLGGSSLVAASASQRLETHLASREDNP